MPERRAEEQPSPAGAAGAGVTQDYWDVVFEQIRRRRLARCALVALALLYASAIYAPLLANDRPYYLEAVDRGEYDEARRGMVGVLASVRDLVAGGRQGYEARAGRTSGGSPEEGEPESRPSFASALAAERAALDLRLERMRRYLAPADHPPLAAFEAQVAELLAAAEHGPLPPALAEALHTRAGELRARYAPVPTGAPENGSAAGGVELVAAASWPLFESLTAAEVALMVVWALVLSWPLWNRALNAWWLGGDPERVRRARRRKLGAVLGAGLLAALVWQLAVGGERTFEVAGTKAGLGAGTIEARRVVFPPLNLGFAETHVEEPLRPPTWRPAAEIDAAGNYVRGGRVPEVDAILGLGARGRPVEVRYGEPERNSPWRHALGTDSLGRDLLVRLLYGGRISLAVGLVSTLLLVSIGVVVGALAGYLGGRADLLISRVIEVVQSIPAFFLILTCVALVPERSLHPIFAIVIFIALVRWTGVARLVRGEFLRLKELDFVVAARALGLSTSRIAFRHVLPNALGPVLVAAAFSVAAGILTESSLSFLGFGIKHPIPSWGSLINESRSAEHWWLQVFPGLLIFATVFSYNLLGEGIRDALDPRTKA